MSDSDDNKPVDPPSKSHLGVMTAQGIIPIRQGFVMVLVENPNHVEGTFFLVLREVDHRKLVFEALSEDRTSTRRVEFIAKWKGDFKSWWRSATKEKTAEEATQKALDNYNPEDYL